MERERKRKSERERKRKGERHMNVTGANAYTYRAGSKTI